MSRKKRILCLCALLAVCLFSNGDGAGFGAAGSSAEVSPFYDIFYMYYGESPSRARSMLRKLQGNPEYKSEALVNYGVIQESERDYKSAAESYNKAMKSGSTMGYSYLFALYTRLNDGRKFELIKSLDASRPGPWVSWEMALEYLRRGNKPAAEAALERAVEQGFNSPDMIRKERLFDQIINSPRFATAVQKISHNRKNRSLMREFESVQNSLTGDSACGMCMQLAGAGLLIRKRDYASAVKILEQFIGKSPSSFRDKSVALFWMARLKSLLGESKSSGEYLSAYTTHLLSDEKDPTGYKKLTTRIYRDIIANDAVLKKSVGSSK